MASTASYHSSSLSPTTVRRPGPLISRYHDLIEEGGLTWMTKCRDLRPLGQGGQGVVYLATRQGADGFSLPVALKAFSPESYRDDEAYDIDMGRIAAVAAKVALIQH